MTWGFLVPVIWPNYHISPTFDENKGISLTELHPGRLTWNIIMEAWKKKTSFLFMGDV